MGKTVRKTVHVTDEQFARHVFKPGDTLPTWAEKLVTNPKVFESDEDDAPEVDTEADQGDGDQVSDQGSGQGDQGNQEGADPNAPRGNASREAWAEYAVGRGVEVTGEMTRDDIRDAVARADAGPGAGADAEAQG